MRPDKRGKEDLRALAEAERAAFIGAFVKQSAVGPVKDDVNTYLATLRGPSVFAIGGRRLPNERREKVRMVQTNVISTAQEAGVANDIAVHFDENRRDSRVFGSSRRGDYIFTVR